MLGYSMEITQRKSSLRRAARRRCEAGELPHDRRVKTWAGPGDGHACSLCDEPIAAAQVEYEVEVCDDDILRIYRFHLLCHETWFRVCAVSNITASSAAPL